MTEPNSYEERVKSAFIVGGIVFVLGLIAMVIAEIAEHAS